jgi:organic hydroperoxide reductase OsmC/OhrA
MAAVRARTFDYSVSLDASGAAQSDRGGAPLPHDETAWTPEHLLLAALARCTLTSLRYHAGRGGSTVDGTADARGTVTARAVDGRYAFVDITVEAQVKVDPALTRESTRELLAKAERDCFVGASLTVAPHYDWTVNGEEIA